VRPCTQTKLSIFVDLISLNTFTINVQKILDGISEMKILAVDKTIRRLCVEVQSDRRDLQCWSSRTEENLLYEACVCMFSSQMVFELAEATAKRLRDSELLRTKNLTDYEQRISTVLSEPLTIAKRPN
jgi:N-glycosylase/DNA lyase